MTLSQYLRDQVWPRLALIRLVEGTVTVDAGDLEGGRGADSLDGHHLGPAATDRLLCEAAITAVLRDPFSGAVLNFGRNRRVVAPAQRAALAIRDGGCSFPGCTAPPEDCDAHHIVFWRNGGRSDIDNLTLACWATHHPLVHEGGWHIVAVPDGRPRWLRAPGPNCLGRRTDQGAARQDDAGRDHSGHEEGQ